MAKSYLVTGGAGFIGSNLTASLLEDGHEVVVVDNLHTGDEGNIPAGAEFINVPCQDQKLSELIPKKAYDAIFHIAGQSSGEVSFEDPYYDCASNTLATVNLLKLSKDLGVKRFVFASTMSVYGDVAHENKVKLDEPLDPVSFYAVGKIASEKYLKLYRDQGIITTSVRLFSIYGPGQNMENLKQGIVSIYLSQALKDKHIHVKGSKDRYRDLVYIDDVVTGFKNFLDGSNDSIQTINFCTGEATTVERMVTLIQEKIEGDISVEYKGSTPGDVRGFVGDETDFRKLIGGNPAIVDDGLEAMVNFYS